MTTNSDPVHIEHSTRRVFNWLLKPTPDNRPTFWEAGERPPHRLYIAVDGYLTQSFPRTGYMPWRDTLAAVIGAIDPGALVRGFSYLKAASHYRAKDTNRSIDRAARRLAQDYRPSALLPTTDIAFSLGGVIAAPGLAQAIKADHGNVEALILVQPAFVLAPDLRMSDWYLESNFRPVREMAESTSLMGSPTGLLLADRILVDLASLTAQGIPIHLLYWPGDEFLAYDQPNTDKDLLTYQLHSLAGVRIEQPLAPKFDVPSPRRHAFRDHAYVASDPDTLGRLATLLRQVLQLA